MVYDGVEPNPTTRIVYDALHFYQEHQCDAIIAIGGGSPIDVAKAVSILSANGGKIQDYNGYNKSKKRGTPIIAVNTTACLRRHGRRDEDKDAHGGHELPCAFGSERPDAHGRHAAFSDGCHRY